MKKIIVLLGLLFSFGLTYAENNDTANTAPFIDIGNDIAAAIRAGDASKLAAYFAPTVELSLPGKSGNYSKAQAQIILGDFFDKNPPASFTMNYIGNISEFKKYYLGNYVTAGKNYKVYYLVSKGNDGNLQLLVLKFE